ncbi:MAG: hypothetical protein RL701_4281 [Pseudomonadota bacterium]|jgi:hypothetical protein
MPEPRDLPHPRKLYSDLRGVASRDARAQAISDFMCACTGAAGGYLLLVRGTELGIAARSSVDPPSSELLNAVMLAWSRESDRPDDSNTKTMDLAALGDIARAPSNVRWQSSQNEIFEHRVLGIYRNSQWTPVGMAMLKVKAGGRTLKPVRQAYIEALCNALLDAGDCAPVQTK